MAAAPSGCGALRHGTSAPRRRNERARRAAGHRVAAHASAPARPVAGSPSGDLADRDRARRGPAADARPRCRDEGAVARAGRGRAPVSSGHHVAAGGRQLRHRDDAGLGHRLCDGALAADGRPALRVARVFPEPAGAGRHHPGLHLDRPGRDRGHLRGRRQQDSERRGDHARGRPGAGPSAARDGAGVRDRPLAPVAPYRACRSSGRSRRPRRDRVWR